VLAALPRDQVLRRVQAALRRSDSLEPPVDAEL
jgi:hypothetical protein